MQMRMVRRGFLLTLAVARRLGSPELVESPQTLEPAKGFPAPGCQILQLELNGTTLKLGQWGAHSFPLLLLSTGGPCPVGPVSYHRQLKTCFREAFDLQVHLGSSVAC
jgi:hypothetical protein